MVDITVDVVKERNRLVPTKDILALLQILWLVIAKWKVLATRKNLVTKVVLAKRKKHAVKVMLLIVKAKRKRDARRRIVVKSLTKSSEIIHEKDCESGPFFCWSNDKFNVDNI
jgi:hypothetical protein